MASASKTKGNSWERDIANHLSKLYNAKFIRCPGSGGFVGGLNAQRKAVMDAGQIQGFKGDIIPPTEWTNFNCEAKNYADFPFHAIVSGEVKQLETWLSQLMQVSDSGDLNILLIKITRKGRFAVVQSSNEWDYSIPHIRYTSLLHGDWMIFDYDKFWELNVEAVRVKVIGD